MQVEHFKYPIKVLKWEDMKNILKMCVYKQLKIFSFPPALHFTLPNI